RGANGQDEQDHRLETEEQDRWGRAFPPLAPKPAHRLGVPKVEDGQGREGQQRQRSGHEHSTAPGFRDVEPVREDQYGGQEYDVLHDQLRHQRVAAQREREHQPVLDDGDPTRDKADHPQLQGSEPGERDRPTAREQGKDASEGRDDGRIEVVQHNVLIPEEGAPPGSRPRQDQDVDQRQRAQPGPYGRFGLGGRRGLRGGGNRRTGGEAAGVGDGGRPDVVDRL